MGFPDTARELIRAGALGHLVTSSADGAVSGIGPWAR
jgi:hypothetical protein